MIAATPATVTTASAVVMRVRRSTTRQLLSEVDDAGVVLAVGEGEFGEGHGRDGAVAVLGRWPCGGVPDVAGAGGCGYGLVVCGDGRCEAGEFSGHGLGLLP